MSEYWKSTPKYWCKHCNTFVRDTKLEKSNHDATAKHQNNLNRLLRNIHQNNEKQQREKQRAKDEVARLNELGPGVSLTSIETAVPRLVPRSDTNPELATAEERRRQMAQLAAMGIAVPDKFRREVAMASDWQVFSKGPVARPQANRVKPEPRNEVKPRFGSTSGTKRQFRSQVEEDIAASEKRLAWGSATKGYKTQQSDEDLDTLLAAADIRPNTHGPSGVTSEPNIKIEDTGPDDLATRTSPDVQGREEVLKLPFNKNKLEQKDGSLQKPMASADVVFKKRKTKKFEQ